MEKSDNIELRANTLIARAYGRDSIEEGYHCSYGIAEDFARELSRAILRVTGWDDDGEIRAVELVTHPFCRHAIPARAQCTGRAACTAGSRVSTRRKPGIKRPAAKVAGH